MSRPAGRLHNRGPRGRSPTLTVLLLVVTAVVLLAVVMGSVLLRAKPVAEDRDAPEVKADTLVEAPDSSLVTAGGSLRRDELLAQLLKRLGVEPGAVALAQAALEQTDFDFRHLHPGDSVTLVYRDSVLVELQYHLDRATSHRVVFGEDTAVARLVVRPVDTVEAAVVGVVHGSLWQSMVDAGADAHLVVDFTDVLRHQVEFPDEVNDGDSFRLLVERLYVDGAFYRFGDLLAVNYRGAGLDAWGFLYRNRAGRSFYCDARGRSLGRLLVYPPVESGMRTSDFGMRMHPIARRRRMHHGVDYSAAYETPVRAVADGTVTLRRWDGGYGRTVRVRHDGGTVTRYSHLARYGPGIRSGARVAKGQVMGYVGSTGYSTGFHLDFGVYRGGRAVDPLDVLPSRYEQVTATEDAGFREMVAGYRARLGQSPANSPQVE